MSACGDLPKRLSVDSVLLAYLLGEDLADLVEEAFCPPAGRSTSPG